MPDPPCPPNTKACFKKVRQHCVVLDNRLGAHLFSTYFIVVTCVCYLCMSTCVCPFVYAHLCMPTCVCHLCMSLVYAHFVTCVCPLVYVHLCMSLVYVHLCMLLVYVHLCMSTLLLVYVTCACYLCMSLVYVTCACYLCMSTCVCLSGMETWAIRHIDTAFGTTHKYASFGGCIDRTLRTMKVARDPSSIAPPPTMEAMVVGASLSEPLRAHFLYGLWYTCWLYSLYSLYSLCNLLCNLLCNFQYQQEYEHTCSDHFGCCIDTSLYFII